MNTIGPLEHILTPSTIATMIDLTPLLLIVAIIAPFIFWSQWKKKSNREIELLEKIEKHLSNNHK